jgi:hypothetical protein
MRLVGSVLMALGLLVGLSLTGFLVTGGSALGLTWLASLVVGKLAFVSSLALMGTGAAFHRLARRRERNLLEDSKRTTQSPQSP